MYDENPESCLHTNHLKRKPSPQELPALRRMLRKRKIPEFSIDHGDHPKLGAFKIIQTPSDLIFEWTLPGQEVKRATLHELSEAPELELDRLDLGWLIADMYQLDGIHQSAHLADPREIMRLMSWFGRHEDQYRHWALVPAGHFQYTAHSKIDSRKE